MESRVVTRIPEYIQQALDDLVENPPTSLVARGRVTQSAVVREALLRGVAALDEERQAERSNGTKTHKRSK